jgi:hypothetical protein
MKMPADVNTRSSRVYRGVRSRVGGRLPCSAALRVNWRLVERRARHLLANWRALLARHVDQARPVLRELLEEPIKFTPIIEDARRGYQFARALNGSVLSGISEVQVSGVSGRNAGSRTFRFSKEIVRCVA